MSQNLIKLISATTPNLEEQCYVISQRWSQRKRPFIKGEVTFLENMKIMKSFLLVEKCIMSVVTYLYLLFWGTVFMRKVQVNIRLTHIRTDRWRSSDLV